MNDRMLLCCWDVLTRCGWREFTVSCVTQYYPEYTASALETSFPTVYHLVTSYSRYRMIPGPSFVWDEQDKPTSLNEVLFQSVITVLDVWWPYRDIMTYAVLDMPLEHTVQCQYHTLSWLYPYWKNQINSIDFTEYTQSSMPFPQDKSAMVMGLVSLFLYTWIFPYAITHSLDELWARLNRASTMTENGIKTLIRHFFESNQGVPKGF